MGVGPIPAGAISDYIDKWLPGEFDDPEDREELLCAIEAMDGLYLEHSAKKQKNESRPGVLGPDGRPAH